MDTSILRKAGLTDSQAKGYLALIEHGALTPTELALKTGETRTNAYALADKLVELQLATKADTPKATYVPESPTKLKQLLVSRQRELKTIDTELSALLPNLLSTYRLTTDKPGVLYLEGAGSLYQIYDDIIKTGETVHIFPSHYDRDDPEISTVIDEQIARQRAAHIKTEVLVKRQSLAEVSSHNDDLFEARPADFEPLDTQILIYGNNVAITTFRSGVVTTVITSPPISKTFRQIFTAMWK